MNSIKKKINFLAIIGMMVAFGTFAFTTPDIATTYWFEVDSNNKISTFLNADPGEPCSGTSTLCAAGLTEDQVDLGDGTQDPIPLTDNPADADRLSEGQLN